MCSRWSVFCSSITPSKTYYGLQSRLLDRPYGRQKILCRFTHIRDEWKSGFKYFKMLVSSNIFSSGCDSSNNPDQNYGSSSPKGWGEENEAEWKLAQRESEQPFLAIARRREEKEVNEKMLARSEKMARVQVWVSPEAWLIVEGRLEGVRSSTTRMKNNDHRHKLRLLIQRAIRSVPGWLARSGTSPLESTKVVHQPGTRLVCFTPVKPGPSHSSQKHSPGEIRAMDLVGTFYGSRAIVVTVSRPSNTII